jgi:hypothetical protein
VSRGEIQYSLKVAQCGLGNRCARFSLVRAQNTIGQRAKSLIWNGGTDGGSIANSLDERVSRGVDVVLSVLKLVVLKELGGGAAFSHAGAHGLWMCGGDYGERGVGDETEPLA